MFLAISGRKSSPFWEAFGAPFRHFFFSGLRDTKKGVREGHSKLDSFFGRFWALPGGPQEGSRLDGSSIFTFAAGPKKDSKMGANMERFGLPNPNYTHFGPPFVRNWCQKSCIEKRLQNLGGRGAARSSSNGALVPLKDNPEQPQPSRSGSRLSIDERDCCLEPRHTNSARGTVADTSNWLRPPPPRFSAPNPPFGHQNGTSNHTAHVAPKNHSKITYCVKK